MADYRIACNNTLCVEHLILDGREVSLHRYLDPYCRLLDLCDTCNEAINLIKGRPERGITLPQQ